VNIGKIARIVGLRDEARRKRKELEGLVVEYVELNRGPKRLGVHRAGRLQRLLLR
jgi:hypothetical protein